MKSISSIILILLISVTLSGCFWDKKVVKAEVVVQHKTVCIDPPKATVVFMRKVDPIAVEDKLGVYWVGISPQHYENLSQNIDDMFGGIKNKNDIIEYYQKCLTETPDATKKEIK